MNISIIVAMAQNHVIGNAHSLPWHLPDDLKHFKQVTLDKPIIMGRKTFESIGRPLPRRRNIVLSTQHDLHIPEVEVMHSVASICQNLQGEAEIMIIGGAQIYAAFLPLANKLYLTQISATVAGDTFFPEIDYTRWQLTHKREHEQDASHAFHFTFSEYIRLQEH